MRGVAIVSGLMCFALACGDEGNTTADTAAGSDVEADVAADVGTDAAGVDAAADASVGEDVPTSTDIDTPLDVADDAVSPPDDTAVEDVAADTTVVEDTATPMDIAEDTVRDDTSGDTAATNSSPTITTAALSDRPVGLAGDAFGLVVAATDPDGDGLTYTWRQLANGAPTGTFTSTNGAGVSWRAPAIAEMTVFAFEVSISDGVNTPVTDTVEVTANVPTFAAHIQPIFSAKCTGCHGSSGGLSLASASAYTNLVNVTGQNASCNTLKRVLPGDPDNSLLVRKISGTTCGNRMPRNDATHFDNNPGDAIRIRAWILAGAAND